MPAANRPDCGPDWMAALKAEVARTTQAATARRLGISGTAVSLLLKGRYTCSTERLEARIRGELMRETVACPVLGEVSRRQCQDEQSMPFAPTNPLRVALHASCRHCPHTTPHTTPRPAPHTGAAHV